MRGRYGAGPTPPGSEAGRRSRQRRDRRRGNRSFHHDHLRPRDVGSTSMRSRREVGAAHSASDRTAWSRLDAVRFWDRVRVSAKGRSLSRPSTSPPKACTRGRRERGGGVGRPFPRPGSSLPLLTRAELGLVGAHGVCAGSRCLLGLREHRLGGSVLDLCSGRQAGHGRQIGHGRSTLPVVPVVPGCVRLEVTSIASPSGAPWPRPAPGLRTWRRRPGSVPSGHWPSGRPLRHDGVS